MARRPREAKSSGPVACRWMTEEEAKADATRVLAELKQKELDLSEREEAVRLRQDELEVRKESLDVQQTAIEEIYKVGPGKPPLETRFKPGQSGNPNGRPRMPSLENVFLKIAGKRIGRAAAAFQQIHPETSQLEAAVHALFESAQTGDNTSIKQVLALTREFVPAGAVDAASEPSPDPETNELVVPNSGAARRQPRPLRGGPGRAIQAPKTTGSVS